MEELLLKGDNKYRAARAHCGFNKLGLHKGAPRRCRWLSRLPIWQMGDKLAAREAHFRLAGWLTELAESAEVAAHKLAGAEKSLARQQLTVAGSDRAGAELS